MSLPLSTEMGGGAGPASLGTRWHLLGSPSAALAPWDGSLRRKAAGPGASRNLCADGTWTHGCRAGPESSHSRHASRVKRSGAVVARRCPTRVARPRQSPRVCAARRNHEYPVRSGSVSLSGLTESKGWTGLTRLRAVLETGKRSNPGRYDIESPGLLESVTRSG